MEGEKIFIDVKKYEPHPFPNAISGDIVEMEDDKTVAPKYFLVMAGVLTLLFITSCLGVTAFVAAVRWHFLAVLQRFIFPSKRRSRASENSTQEPQQNTTK